MYYQTFNKMLLLFLAFSCTGILASPIEIVTTTENGVIPGANIQFVVSSDGTARSIWSPGSSDNGTWFWVNNFPEFVSTSSETLTVTFDQPLPINRIVLGVNSISNGIFTFTVSGGNGSVTDFNLTDGLADVGGTAEAQYDPLTGIFSANGQDQSLMLGSSSDRTVSQFMLSGNNSPDGYTLFFGFTTDIIFSDSFESF